jgi:hypothetical protein
MGGGTGSNSVNIQAGAAAENEFSVDQQGSLWELRMQYAI